MKPTGNESKFMMMVKGLGCQICLMETGETVYAEFHHIRRGGEKKKHWRGIPLCPKHHRTGGYGIALEAGKKTWENSYGVQETLMHAAYSRLEKVYSYEYHNFIKEVSTDLLFNQPCFGSFWSGLQKIGIDDHDLECIIKAQFADEHIYTRDWEIDFVGGYIVAKKFPGISDCPVMSSFSFYGEFIRKQWRIKS